MCSECSEDDGPVCIYCGTYCYGHCEDPDTCQTCWRAAYSPNMSEDEEDFTGQCVDDFCRCKCHDDIYEKVGIRFEAGAIFCDQDVVPVYERKGIFPFLALAGEIREKIYGYAMLQDGKQRSCANHRGAIHTALLRTCRQVYSEARHVPLTINRLCFSSPLHAHDFFGFTLAPSVRQLVTGLHVEYHMLEFTANTWTLLLRQLAKMSITHLGLTLKGRYPNDAILGHTCFSNRFLVLTGLKSLDLVLATAMISHEVKQHIQEEIKTRLIKSYIPKPELEKSPNALTSKRTATSDDEHMTIKPAKRAKKESENVGLPPQTISHEYLISCRQNQSKPRSIFFDAAYGLTIQKMERYRRFVIVQRQRYCYNTIVSCSTPLRSTPRHLS